jgi:hypothetical protein
MEVRTPDYAPKRDAYRNEKRDSYLREFCFIDPAILAAELGHDENWIKMRMRHLGLLKCRRNR